MLVGFNHVVHIQVSFSYCCIIFYSINTPHFLLLWVYYEPNCYEHCLYKTFGRHMYSFFLHTYSGVKVLEL